MSSKPPDIWCPHCFGLAKIKADEFRFVYSCDDHPNWMQTRHRRVSKALRRARLAAHKAFDPLWKSGQLSRAQAYVMLAFALNIKRGECHMGLMDINTALKVPGIVQGIIHEIQYTEDWCG